MKEYDREVKKAYERMGKLKSDVNCTPKPVSVLMFVFTAITILCVGVVLFTPQFEMLVKFAPWVAMGCALALILLYAICRSRGPLKYMEVMIKYEGVYLLFQVINEKNVIFTDGNVTLHCKKDAVTEIDAIMNPHLSYDAPLKAEFDKKELARTGINYEGVAEYSGKKVKYVVTTEKKFVTGFKANGKRVFFDCINKKDALLTLSKPMSDAIKERGISLPKDVITK